MKKNNKGFSLAELIVVVLILGILAVAVTPQIMNWINKSKIAKDEMYAGTVVTAVESVALEYLGKGTLGAGVQTYELTDTAGSEVVHKSGAVDLSADIKSMIGADKCEKPTQSGKSKYVITITPNGNTVEVTCVPQ